MHASNETVSEDEEEDDVFSRRSLYYGRAGSDVMGCRRPTDGVFTYVSSDTSHAEGVPRSDPRGCSSKFPWGGTIHSSCISIFYKCFMNWVFAYIF